MSQIYFFWVSFFLSSLNIFQMCLLNVYLVHLETLLILYLKIANRYISKIKYGNYKISHHCKGLFECPITLFSFIIVQHLHFSLIQIKGLS